MFLLPSTPKAANSNARKTRLSSDDTLAASEDLLFEFFDFFDKTVDDVYSYIEHRTRVPEIAEDITLKLYFSLLQRQRLFWWRNSTQLPDLFSLADKSIAGVVQWQEAANGDAYGREIARYMPGKTEEEMVERAQLLLRALKKLPLREQKMAVIRFFLRWPAAKTAALFSMKKDIVEKAYEITLHHFISQLESEPAFRELSVEKVLKRIHCRTLSESEKAEMRLAILEKFRAAQMSSLRYVMPVAALLLVATSVTGGLGLSVVAPISAQSGIRTVAAAEILLLEEKRDIRDTLDSAEQKSRALAAAFAERDLAFMSIDLAKPAIKQQLELEENVHETIEKLKAESLLSRTFRRAVSMVFERE